MRNSWNGETDKAIEISVPPSPPAIVGNSTIDAFLTMRGDLESDADILVKGRVYGNVSCNFLIVDEGANIEGGITANQVVIRGAVNGTIKAEKVSLERTAQVRSDIYQNTFIAEEGANVLGTLQSLQEAQTTNNVVTPLNANGQARVASTPPPIPMRRD